VRTGAVAAGTGRGTQVRQIAAGLTVADAMARQHLRHLYRKLDVPPGPGRRARLVRKTVTLGLPLPGALPDDQQSGKTALPGLLATRAAADDSPRAVAEKTKPH